MKTVRLADGKYEFDLEDGQMVDARRHGEHWPAAFEDRFNHAFVAALDRIVELEGKELEGKLTTACRGEELCACGNGTYDPSTDHNCALCRIAIRDARYAAKRAGK